VRERRCDTAGACAESRRVERALRGIDDGANDAASEKRCNARGFRDCAASRQFSNTVKA
jgi:hypothetical protein